jgi:hypothetical protein
MAPEESGTDIRISARKNLRIVFLHSEARENLDPVSHDRDRYVGIANAANCSNARYRNAGKCGQICGDPLANAEAFWINSAARITI